MNMGLRCCTKPIERLPKKLGLLGQSGIPVKLIMIGLVLMLLFSPSIAWAATHNPTDSAAPTPSVDETEIDSPLNNPKPDADDIPSETVSRFVEAYLAVVELIESQEANLQRAETDTESHQLQQEIQAQAIGLIQDYGLTLQSYWELLGLANSDPEFRERVLAQVEEASL
jgi:hypothetical protein